MRIRVLGGVGEKGRVGFELIDEGVILDFGVKRKPHAGWDEIYPLKPLSATSLFLSHVHTDHTGAVPLLGEIDIFTTEITASKLKDYIRGWIRTCENWNIPIDEGKYRAFLERDLRLRPFPRDWVLGSAGHVPGSVWVKIGDLLYTGDINPSSPSFDISKLPKARVLILDVAYGDEEVPGPEALLEIIEKNRGKKIVMPLPPFGRSQEILAFLLNSGVEPLFVDEEILRNSEVRCDCHDFDGSSIGVYLLTDGMMTSGKSLEFFKRFAEDENTVFLITGYAEIGTPAHEILKRKNGIRVIWKVHPSPSECIEIVDVVQPEFVIPFHSSFEKAENLIKNIERTGARVLKPKIGEVVDL